MDRMLATEAYFDPTEATLTVVTPKNQVLRTTAIPEEILEDTRARQETWVRTQIRKMGSAPQGRSMDYPWGFFYQVR